MYYRNKISTSTGMTNTTKRIDYMYMIDDRLDVELYSIYYQ